MTIEHTKRELKTFALETIPSVLAEAGGRLNKAQLHAVIEQSFTEEFGVWPQVLSETDGAAHRHASNAIAWALALLTQREVIYPTTGTHIVQLRQRDAQSSRSSGPNARETTGAANATASGDAGTDPERQKKEIENLVRARARSAINRASKAGLPYDESFIEDSIRMIRDQDYCCSLSGHPFDIEFRTSGAGGTHFAPSPDRIRAKDGYTQTNVRWILWCINRGKGELDVETYIEICRKVARYN